MNATTLITPEYRAINAAMHQADPKYGRMGGNYAAYVQACAVNLKAASILDYGCGKHTLREAMPNWPDFREYDPAMPGFDMPPEPADMVTCTDVMEHIEPEHLDAVLDDIARLAIKGTYFVIAMKPAERLLPDGTNPHKIIEHEGWWLAHLTKRWRLMTLENNRKRFWALMEVRT